MSSAARATRGMTGRFSARLRCLNTQAEHWSPVQSEHAQRRSDTTLTSPLTSPAHVPALPASAGKPQGFGVGLSHVAIATVRCERWPGRQADTGCVSSVTDTRAAVRHG
jgi:hypothetical protein